MFKLKSLKTSGFKRLDLTDKLEFPDGRLLIHGRNESGKSTILLAIDFALFGLRKPDLSGGSLLRNGQNTGSVELNFEVDGNKRREQEVAVEFLNEVPNPD